MGQLAGTIRQFAPLAVIRMDTFVSFVGQRFPYFRNNTSSPVNGIFGT